MVGYKPQALINIAENVCALTKHKYLFSIEGLSDGGKQQPETCLVHLPVKKEKTQKNSPLNPFFPIETETMSSSLCLKKQ